VRSRIFLPPIVRALDLLLVVFLLVTGVLQAQLYQLIAYTRTSPIVFSGKMSAVNYMEDENLYVSFPKGIANGNPAHVLGTWTKDGSGNKKSQLTLVGTCRFIAEEEFFIVKEGVYYRLKVNISGEKIDVILMNKSYELHSKQSILSKLS
jgi:hypothetical protein